MTILFAWAAAGILPFALFRTQLPVYVMPAFPAIALISGWCLDEVLKRKTPWELRLALVITVALMALSLLSLAIINRYTFSTSAWSTLTRRMVGFGTVTIVLLFFFRRGQMRAVAATLLAATVAMAADAAWVEGPGMSRHFSSHRFVKPLMQRAPDATLLAVGPSPRYALLLYLKGRIPGVYLAHAIDFVRFSESSEVVAALVTGRSVYESASRQLNGRLQLLDQRGDAYLVRIAPGRSPLNVSSARPDRRPPRPRQEHGSSIDTFASHPLGMPAGALGSEEPIPPTSPRSLASRQP